MRTYKEASQENQLPRWKACPHCSQKLLCTYFGNLVFIRFYPTQRSQRRPLARSLPLQKTNFVKSSFKEHLHPWTRARESWVVTLEYMGSLEVLRVLAWNKVSWIVPIFVTKRWEQRTVISCIQGKDQRSLLFGKVERVWHQRGEQSEFLLLSSAWQKLEPHSFLHYIVNYLTLVIIRNSLLCSPTELFRPCVTWMAVVVCTMLCILLLFVLNNFFKDRSFSE